MRSTDDSKTQQTGSGMHQGNEEPNKQNIAITRKEQMSVYKATCFYLCKIQVKTTINLC